MARKDKEKEEKPLILTGKLPQTPSDITAYLNEQLGLPSVANIGGKMPTVATGSIYQTGILSLDWYLVVGGLLGGRIIDVFGWEGTGKTLTALMLGAKFQQAGLRFAFMDAEGTLSLPMAKAVGVNVNNMIVVSSTTEKVMCAEDYFDTIAILIQLGVEFIVVDSVPALVPSYVMQKKLGEGQKATQSQIMSEGLAKLTALLSANKKTCLYFINQMRARPMAGMFQPSEASTGGNALKFYASVRLEVKQKDAIIKKVIVDGRTVNTQVGVRNRYILEKNKTATIPVQPIEIDVYFMPKDGSAVWTLEEGGTIMPGVDIYDDMFQCGVNTGVIEQNSSHYSFGPIKGNGKDKFVAALRKASPMTLLELREQVLGSKKPVSMLSEEQQDKTE